MRTAPLPLAEARRRLGALVERVARGGAPVMLGRYGRERAVLIAADEYARLTRRTTARARRRARLEGTLELRCTPEELAEESRRLAELWLASVTSPAPPRQRRSRRR